jgi:hypothetical protein
MLTEHSGFRSRLEGKKRSFHSAISERFLNPKKISSVNRDWTPTKTFGVTAWEIALRLPSLIFQS